MYLFSSRSGWKSIILFFLLYSAELFPQEYNYQLDTIVVTASKSPITTSDLTRDVVIIGRQQINSLPVSSVQDILQYTGGIDLRQRGINGVQADVNLRGGNYEETLILIDGIKVSDPQTGHHNLNLPIELENIERIEVLKGQGSRIFGPNAFSGVINFITKRGNVNSFFLEATGGQNHYFGGIAGGSYSVGSFYNYISLAKTKSDGYRHNTNYDRINFSYNPSLKAGNGRINLFFGYNDNKFGANGFYGAVYPNQWEHTTTKFLNASAEFGNELFSISPKVYWRRNDDNYLLDYQRPELYENNHRTNVYGAELQSSVQSEIGTTSLGGEYIDDQIKSSNLGNHSRNKKGFFAEQKISPLENFSIIAGASIYDYSGLGWKFWPGLDLGYSFSKYSRVYASAGKAFRIPDYTELYYSSPISIGNPYLSPEEIINYEVGINYLKDTYSVKFSFFRKEGKNLIDWVRNSTDGPWAVKNITSLNTTGIETNVSIRLKSFYNKIPINRFSIDYSFLSSDKRTEGFQSEYLLDFLRNQLIVNVENSWWLGIHQNWYFKYEDRINFEDHFITDTQLYKTIGYFDVFLKVTNLFNKSYQQISGVPLPGRWIITGIKFKISE